MYTYEYPRPMFTTDCMVFNFMNKDIELLLIERGHEPFKGMWATPGGFMEMDEEPEVCAMRELEEETGIKVPKVYFSALGGGVGRDPRGRLLSAFYFSLLRKFNDPISAGDDAANARWYSVRELPECATDHKIQIKKALTLIRDNSIACHTAYYDLFKYFASDEVVEIGLICQEVLLKL